MTRARSRVVWTATGAGIEESGSRPSRFLLAAADVDRGLGSRDSSRPYRQPGERPRGRDPAPQVTGRPDTPGGGAAGGGLGARPPPPPHLLGSVDLRRSGRTGPGLRHRGSAGTPLPQPGRGVRDLPPSLRLRAQGSAALRILAVSHLRIPDPLGPRGGRTTRTRNRDDPDRPPTRLTASSMFSWSGPISAPRCWHRPGADGPRSCSNASTGSGRWTRPRS
jgi:hypothetical protein